MIKWPEPLDKMYVFLQAGLVVYSEDQLKQAVRDALELARDAVEELSYDASRGDCADAIRALIKEIPE